MPTTILKKPNDILVPVPPYAQYRGEQLAYAECWVGSESGDLSLPPPIASRSVIFSTASPVTSLPSQ